MPARLWPAILVVYACLLPRELNVEIGGAVFQTYRLALVAMLPLVVRQLRRNPLKITFIDFCAGFAAIWHFIALFVTSPIDVALIRGLGASGDFALAYLTARTAIRDSGDFRRLFVAVLPGLAVTGLIVAIESIAHQHIFRPALAKLVGQPVPQPYYEVRWGLLRATGPFPHPILGGTMLASTLPLACFATRQPWQRAAGLFAAMCSIFAVSSTSLLNLVLNAGLVGAVILQRIARIPILALIGLYSALAATTIAFASGGGLFSFVIRYATVDSQTGYYRMLIWEYAGAEAANHPIFGIGMRDWARPDWMRSGSIDAHWLLVTMQFGFPMGIAVLLVVLGSAALVLRRAGSFPVAEANVRYALAFSLLSLVFSGFSVAFWEGIYIWIILLAGMAVSVAQSAPALARGSLPAPDRLRWRAAPRHHPLGGRL